MARSDGSLNKSGVALVPRTPGLPSSSRMRPSGEYLTSWLPLTPSTTPASTIHTLPSASNSTPCGNTNFPAPKLRSSLPEGSNTRIGSTFESAQEFAPHRSNTQMLPLLSTLIALVDPIVRPAGMVTMSYTVRYGFGSAGRSVFCRAFCGALFCWPLTGAIRAAATRARMAAAVSRRFPRPVIRISPRRELTARVGIAFRARGTRQLLSRSARPIASSGTRLSKVERLLGGSFRYTAARPVHPVDASVDPESGPGLARDHLNADAVRILYERVPQRRELSGLGDGADAVRVKCLECRINGGDAE